MAVRCCVFWAAGSDGMDRHFQLTNGGSRFIQNIGNHIPDSTV